MSLPSLVELSDFEASSYVEEIYLIFNSEVVCGKLKFLDLPIVCPWHPATDDKHFCFWHLISEKFNGGSENERIPDMRRCERIKWISYVITNSNNKEDIWCWEKNVKTRKGRSKHVMLYFHKECYLVVLRRKGNRFELVTAYIKRQHNKMIKEKENYNDPR